MPQKTAPTTSRMHLNRHALAEARESRELSKKEAADLLDISLSYYCDLEKGHRPGTPALIAKIADKFKCRKLALLANPDDFEQAAS